MTETQNISGSTELGNSGFAGFGLRAENNDYATETKIVPHDPEVPKRPKKVKDKSQIVLTGWC